MGKKRKSIKRESSQNEEAGKDDFVNLNLNIIPVVVVVFASIGFCVGNGGSTSLLPLPNWSISGMVGLLKYFVRPFGSQETRDFFYNGRNDRDAFSSPLVFAALREAIIREGGFVHPDLGIMVPAPSGAHRGIGMIREPVGADEINRHRTEIIQGDPSHKWNALLRS
jgi:hypothetical protein